MIEGYTKPASVAPGDRIAFKVSSPVDFDLVVLRLNSIDPTSLGEPVWGPARIVGIPQRVPATAGAACGWDTTMALTIPKEWQSGIYGAQCTGVDGSRPAHIPFIVKPKTGERGDVATLANLNTWNAYNPWGAGQSKYDGVVESSFERPYHPDVGNPLARPGLRTVWILAELWVLDWFEQFYVVDTYADQDLDVGIPALSEYKALLLNTHPEYWTLAMWDHLVAYLDGGGCVLSLAGNCLFERCEYNADRSGLIFYGGDASIGRNASAFRNLSPPRSERNLLGSAFLYNNMGSKPSPYEVLDASHRFFIGTTRAGGGRLVNGDKIGLVGRNRNANQDPSFGAASGWEMDTSIAGTAPDGVIVTSTQGDDRGTPPGNLRLLARGTNSSAEDRQSADMTFYAHPGGGFVFAVGSLTFGGSLVEDPNLQQIVLNAADEALHRLSVRRCIQPLATRLGLTTVFLRASLADLPEVKGDPALGVGSRLSLRELATVVKSFA